MTEVTFNKNTTIQNYALSFVYLAIAGVIFVLAGFALTAINHALLAVVACAWTPIFLFILPSMTLLLTAGVIFLKQPVHNLLCLIAIFFNTVLLYLYSGAEFVAFLFLIVYVGAVAILFLFVIMLLHLKEVKNKATKRTPGTVKVAITSVVLIAAGLSDYAWTGLKKLILVNEIVQAKAAKGSVEAVTWFVNYGFADINIFSVSLYTTHSMLFFLSSLLLLTAMLGAIVLASTTTDRK
jgi:NADH-quinone oxidoreductase subunit J